MHFAVGILLIGAIFIGALTLVTGGKGLLFTLAAGQPPYIERSARLAMAACAVTAALALVLWCAARAYPRRYFQFRQWRDRVLAISAIALLASVAIPVGYQMIYGLR